jgi:hypothetical protein
MMYLLSRQIVVLSLGRVKRNGAPRTGDTGNAGITTSREVAKA